MIAGLFLVKPNKLDDIKPLPRDHLAFIEQMKRAALAQMKLSTHTHTL